MFLIALAAQISAPAPERPNRWFSSDDTPPYLIRAGSGLWRVSIRVTVAPDGKLRSCDVESSGGISDLNKRTCGIVVRRAKFQPARVDGLPVFGVYRNSVVWAVVDAPVDTSKVMYPDVEVTVARLPTRLKSPTFVGVAFAVDTAANKSSCVMDVAVDPEQVENHPALVPIACEQIMAKYQATPATDGTGKAVLSVQSALVQFSAE